jgi:hypothetical protein
MSTPPDREAIQSSMNTPCSFFSLRQSHYHQFFKTPDSLSNSIFFQIQTATIQVVKVVYKVLFRLAKLPNYGTPVCYNRRC